MTRLFAMLALGQIPESLTNRAADGFDQGGYKAVAVVALAGCVATSSLCFWLIKKFVDHLQAASAVALEQAKADVRTSDRLTSMENGMRAKGIIT